MNTNTMMLIALGVILVLSAVGIWLVNRGSGVESPPSDAEEDETIESTESTETSAETSEDTRQ